MISEVKIIILNFSGLIILTGPSGIGKTPLLKASQRFYPKIFEKTQRIILYNDRQPRPNEQNGVDYWFLSRNELENMALQPGFIRIPSRADFQIIDTRQIVDILNNKKSPLFEGNPYVAFALKRVAAIMKIPVLSVFISPLGSVEVRNLQNTMDSSGIKSFIEMLMVEKLTRRTLQQYGYVDESHNLDNHLRASKAYYEISHAWKFGKVIPNQDGEDSNNWFSERHPDGPAGVTLKAWIDLLSGVHNVIIETWEKGLFNI